MRGIVIKNTGSWYTVKTAENQIYHCKIKGKFRLKEIRTTNPIAVGDNVRFSKEQHQEHPVITHICERKNYIIRRSSNLSKQAQIIAANIDLALLIITIKHPETYTIFIDRFLATAAAYQVPTTLVINKIDIYNEQELNEAKALQALYQSIGYPTYLISALDATTISPLRAHLQHKTTLISGNSGVGKSTLINQLIPHLHRRTQPISQYHKKGMHTTTFSEMFDLPDGGAIIDTPGIKGFGTIEMETNNVGHYFKEIFRYAHNCKYNNCTHIHEPQCAVKQAIEEQKISPSRYQSYQNILADTQENKYR